MTGCIWCGKLGIGIKTLVLVGGVNKLRLLPRQQNMVEVRKRDNESTEGLMRRFSRRVQHSGVLLQARKIRFHMRKKGRRKMREDAIRKAGIQTERERLIKLGEIDEYAAPQHKQNYRRK